MSIPYDNTDPKASSFQVVTGLALEVSKSLPAIGPLIATVERIHAEHEQELLRAMLAELSERVFTVESQIRTIEGANLTLHALKLGASDIRPGKQSHYVNALISLLPDVANNRNQYELALRILDGLSHLDERDIKFLSQFSTSSTLVVQDLVAPHSYSVPDIGAVKRTIRELWPVVMRLQGFGLVIVSSRPIALRQGQVVDVDEYREFIDNQVSLSELGKDVVECLGLRKHRNWSIRQAGSTLDCHPRARRARNGFHG